MKEFCINPNADVEDILAKMKAGEDLDSFIAKLVEEKVDLIKERGDKAFKPLMGLVMKEFRGKVDGKIIAEKLMKAIREKMAGL